MRQKYKKNPFPDDLPGENFQMKKKFSPGREVFFLILSGEVTLNMRAKMFVFPFTMLLPLVFFDFMTHNV